MEINSPKKIAVIGPECTGKSELAQFLATHFGVPWVKEYARKYLTNLNRPYQKCDLVKIAQGQIRAEEELIPKTNQLLICDTNLLVIKIWSDIKYGQCSKNIIKIINSRVYNLHLLTFIDIPWEEDPQREHPHKRKEIWDVYINELAKQQIPYVEIRGKREQRRKTALRAVMDVMKNKPPTIR